MTTTQSNALVDIDVESLTLEDMCELEDAFGEGFGKLLGQVGTNAKITRHVVWLVRRRTEPDLTLEAAGKSVTLADVAAKGKAASEQQAGNGAATAPAS